MTPLLEWMECEPILLAAMWSESFAIAEMASHNAFLICLEMRSYLLMADIVVPLLATG